MVSKAEQALYDSLVGATVVQFQLPNKQKEEPGYFILKLDSGHLVRVSTDHPIGDSAFASWLDIKLVK